MTNFKSKWQGNVNNSRFKMKIAKRIISKHYWTKHTLTNKTCDVDSKIWLCILWYSIKSCYMQKQLTRGVLSKRCSENMQQIDRRTPMLECDFKKVAKQAYWTTLCDECSPENLRHIFKTLFPKNTSGRLLLYMCVFILLHIHMLDYDCYSLHENLIRICDFHCLHDVYT